MNRGFKDIKLICLLTILIFCVFLFGCSEDKAKTKPASEKQSTTEKTDNDDFTLLIYMCGSSLESKNGSASDDISELLSAEIPDKVNVVLETGGSLRWKKHGISSDKLQRYEVSDNKLVLLNESKLCCMGDSSTLKDFIDWGIKEFPSERTALILWDHGGGFLKGICKDEMYNNDWLTVQEFDEALSESTFSGSFEFIGFDCCLMANYETALTVSKYADYMIASEDDEPTGGWDYKAVAEALGTKSFYDVILNSYEKSHQDSDDYTLSAIKLNEFDKVKAVLSQCIDKAERSNNRLIMSKAVQECESFGSSIAYLYDFGDIADYFDVDYDFSKIIKAVKSETKSNISGLNICFPSDDEKALENYLMISEDKNYCDYLKNNY